MDRTKLMQNLLKKNKFKEIYMYIQAYPEDKLDFLIEAANAGKVSMVEYLIEKCGCDPKKENYEVLCQAALKGQLNVVKLLIKKYECNPHTNNELPLRLALISNKLKVAKYLIEECGCNPNEKLNIVLSTVVVNGYLNVLKYMVENCDCNPNDVDKDFILKRAVESNNLTIVKYLIEKCAYDVKRVEGQVLAYTVENGNLPLLKYLVENLGCELDEGFLFFLRPQKPLNKEVLLYLLEKGVWHNSFNESLTVEILKKKQEIIQNETVYRNIKLNSKNPEILSFIDEIIKKKTSFYKDSFRKEI